MEEKIINILAEYTEVDVRDIQAETDIVQKLGISSLDLVSIVNDIEQEFDIEIPLDNIRTFKTVCDINNYLNKMIK